MNTTTGTIAKTVSTSLRRRQMWYCEAYCHGFRANTEYEPQSPAFRVDMAEAQESGLLDFKQAHIRPDHPQRSKVNIIALNQVTLLHNMATQSNVSFSFYLYAPSLAAAIAFIALFTLTSIVHLAQLFRSRTWYFIPLIFGAICKPPLQSSIHRSNPLTTR